MRKAQGALEYLIIIAAVLAIAAIVVLFLTGAFRGATGGGDLAKCRLAAANCANGISAGIYTLTTIPLKEPIYYARGCLPSCVAACADSAGYDLLVKTVQVNPTSCTTYGAGSAVACFACIQGNTQELVLEE